MNGDADETKSGMVVVVMVMMVVVEVVVMMVVVEVVVMMVVVRPP